MPADVPAPAKSRMPWTSETEIITLQAWCAVQKLTEPIGNLSSVEQVLHVHSGTAKHLVSLLCAAGYTPVHSLKHASMGYNKHSLSWVLLCDGSQSCPSSSSQCFKPESHVVRHVSSIRSVGGLFHIHRCPEGQSLRWSPALARRWTSPALSPPGTQTVGSQDCSNCQATGLCCRDSAAVKPWRAGMARPTGDSYSYAYQDGKQGLRGCQLGIPPEPPDFVP